MNRWNSRSERSVATQIRRDRDEK